MFVYVKVNSVGWLALMFYRLIIAIVVCLEGRICVEEREILQRS